MDNLEPHDFEALEELAGKPTFLVYVRQVLPAESSLTVEEMWSGENGLHLATMA